MSSNSSIDKKVSFTSADTIPVKVMLDEDLAKATAGGKIIPLHVQFMPTNVCNLNCPYCSCSERDRGLAIPIEDAKKIIDICAGLGTKAVTVTGGGEPLCYPHFAELIDHFASHGIKIGLISNGILLNNYTAETLGKMTWCRISTGDDRDISPKYLSALHEAVSKAPGVDWAFSHVVTDKPNLELLRSIIEFANDHDFTHVRIVNDILHPEDDPGTLIKDSLKDIDDSLVVYQGGKEYTPGGDCYVGYLKPVIGPDMQVYPCCGVQYASEIPSRDLSKEFSLGHAFDLAAIIEKSDVPFDGNKCVRCYYSRYNLLLGSMIRETKHKEFV